MNTHFYKETIDKTFDRIRTEAEENQICKRKAVGSAILLFDVAPDLITIITAINGPSHPTNECTNEVGNCGCSHAEPKVILHFLQKHQKEGNETVILLSTYSPCVPCANLIIEAGFIDAVAYEIYAPHWARGVEMLRKVLPVWHTREQITEELLHDFFTK